MPWPHTRLAPSNLGRVLLCSGASSHITVPPRGFISLSCCLTWNRETGSVLRHGWTHAAPQEDRRHSKAATAPWGTCSWMSVACVGSPVFWAGQEASTKTLAQVKLQLRDPQGAQTGLVHTLHSLQGQWHGAQQLPECGMRH